MYQSVTSRRRYLRSECVRESRFGLSGTPVGPGLSRLRRVNVMVSLRCGAALVGVLLAGLLVLQLLVIFKSSDGPPNVQTNRKPAFIPEGSDTSFLLGTGKADITG